MSTVESVPAIHLSLESGHGPDRVLRSKCGGQHLGGLSHPLPKDERFEHRSNGADGRMEDFTPFDFPSQFTLPILPQLRSSHLEGSGVAVRKWTQGRVRSWGRTDTMLAVVRKPPESIQIPLSLFLRMSIITSAVMPPAKQDRVRGPRAEGDLWPQTKPPPPSYGRGERLAAPWPSRPSPPFTL